MATAPRFPNSAFGLPEHPTSSHPQGVTGVRRSRGREKRVLGCSQAEGLPGFQQMVATETPSARGLPRLDLS